MSLADLDRLEMTRPASLSELCALVATRAEQAEPTVLLAGGTDYLVELKQAPPADPPRGLPLVADVGRLAELRGIDWDGRVLRIGAANTYAEIARDPIVHERLPLLERMTHDIGGPTIQARGTLGGNLATASPAADGVTAIAACDAVIVVQSVRGPRRIPFGELQTGYKQSTRRPEEVIVAVEIVPPPPGAPWVWRKVGARRAQA
ncbi:MAG: FAD binding domain-containing protein, partial [Deltaproteobacteria bacterium]|nr:FAD binding domain-containing protein [Deltaproteobacteria bacterium]MBW2530822.1 FAD binding domain-containing protein [Deltaproteobacteria bacterium]